MKTTSKVLTILLFSLFFGCSSETPITNEPPNILENTYGYGILKKVKGIWNGPVTSTTAIGSFPEWVVDFRPISENQICAKNELDKQNDIFMSFFIVKHNNKYKVAFRNGGSFTGMQRVSYLLADSVSETTTKSFYRFSEAIIGKTRAHTDVLFRKDSIYLKSYTNIYNSLANPTLHMSWSAKRQDITSGQTAVVHFSFPKKSITKDFSTTFDGRTESMYFSTSGVPADDPYPETAHPYLGKTDATYSFAAGFTADPSKKVFLIITTQPLFSGILFNPANLKYRTRYVILNADDTDFTFNYMHPGTYYYYALYDNDGNNTFNSGDWISIANETFTLDALSLANTSTQINFVIP